MKRDSKKYIKRKSILWLTLLLLICLLTGCSANKEDVKLATDSQIKKYAKSTYGSAKYLETTEGEFERMLTFRDKKYGFEYYVKSYVQAVGIDGSVAGYTEAKASDFHVKYCDTLSPMVKEKCKSEVKNFSAMNTKEFYCKVINVDPDDAEKVSKEVAKTVRSLDKRKFFTDGEIRIYVGDEEKYLGAYFWKEQKYMSYAEHTAQQMLYYVQSDVNRPGSEEKEIKYLRYEEMPIKEVPGIEEYELVNEKLTEDSITTVFYFDIGGEEHFYCDVEVWKNNSNRYYSSFDYSDWIILQELKKNKNVL